MFYVSGRLRGGTDSDDLWDCVGPLERTSRVRGEGSGVGERIGSSVCILRVLEALGGSSVRVLHVREAHLYVVYVSWRFLEAHLYVFYVSWRLWEAHLYVFYVSGRLICT